MSLNPYALPPGPGRRQLLRDDYLDIRPSDYTEVELASLQAELAAQRWSTGRETIAGDRMPNASLFPPGPTRRALLHAQYRNICGDDFTEDERVELAKRAVAMLAVLEEMRSANTPID